MMKISSVVYLSVIASAFCHIGSDAEENILIRLLRGSVYESDSSEPPSGSFMDSDIATVVLECLGGHSTADMDSEARKEFVDRLTFNDDAEVKKALADCLKGDDVDAPLSGKDEEIRKMMLEALIGNDAIGDPESFAMNMEARQARQVTNSHKDVDAANYRHTKNYRSNADVTHKNNNTDELEKPHFRATHQPALAPKSKESKSRSEEEVVREAVMECLGGRVTEMDDDMRKAVLDCLGRHAGLSGIDETIRQKLMLERR